MITEEQILKDIRKISLTRNFRELDLLISDISRRIENAARIDFKTKRRLRENMRERKIAKENVLAGEISSQISNLCVKISRKINSAGSLFMLGLVENEVIGSYTEFSFLEKKLLGAMSPLAKRLLVEIRANRDALANQISNKLYEFEKEEFRRKAEKERLERAKREERRRREEEERKRKEEEERRRREAERRRLARSGKEG